MTARAALAALALFAAPASAETYFALNLASYHVNPQREFNQVNTGFAVGVRAGNAMQYGGEVGFYENSYSDTTVYGLAFADWQVAKNVRLGPFAGAFRYPNLVDYAERSGIPRVGDFVVMAGLQATIEFQPVDLVVRLLPGGNKSAAIATASIAWGF